MDKETYTDIDKTRSIIKATLVSSELASVLHKLSSIDGLTEIQKLRIEIASQLVTIANENLLYATCLYNPEPPIIERQ